MTKFNSRSRYRNTPQEIVDGENVVGVWVQPDYIVERPSNSYISKYYVTNAMEGRPDLISQQMYGVSDLDWVIVAFNRPIETLNWPSAGTTIDIPRKDLVISQL